MKCFIDIPKEAIKTTAEEMLRRLRIATIDRLQTIGEECIAHARNLGDEYRGLSAEQLEEMRHRRHTPNYIDDTGNLRQSVGYLIAEDGKVLTADFRNQHGENLANSVLSRHSKGIVLIMVAGMAYAEEVTARGYDVLDSAVIMARKRYLKFVDDLNDYYAKNSKRS